MFTFREIADITGGKFLNFSTDREITHFVTDSRRSLAIKSAVFVAVEGERHDGHQFVYAMHQKGIDQFIVEKKIAVSDALRQTNILQVDQSVDALQMIAAAHRRTFDIPVIGITGSNGKTIVKEWLGEILSPEFRVARNPKSYNSQLGVPLSVLQLENYHNLALFEAGISTRGEMQRLERIISPTSGIFTNIGSAHDEGFRSREEKCREKWRLFKDAEMVIYCADHPMITETRPPRGPETLTWGKSKHADIRVAPISGKQKTVQLQYRGDQYNFFLPFSDPASLENIIHCVVAALYLGMPYDKIFSSVKALRKVSMRMELKQGINGCRIIDDSYTNDIAGLESALDFLLQQPAQRHTAILSDVLQTGMPEDKLYKSLKHIIGGKKVGRLIGVGPAWVHAAGSDIIDAEVYPDTEAFLQAFDMQTLRDEAVLVKGARIYAFESIVDAFMLKVHGTTLEVNLDALSRNLNYFRKLLDPGVKTMAMVKAFAYGSGSYEVANLMQLERVDYLGVAFVDEGVELRKHGISLPVMVMNSTPGSAEKLLGYDLEPEVYSIGFLNEIAASAGKTNRKVGVHIKLDTGMHRLGFEKKDLHEISDAIQDVPNMEIRSIFTHLAAADESCHDAFTRQQVHLFLEMVGTLTSVLGYRPLLHVLNSAGISRYPEYQLDMVRLGIGLYGYDADADICGGIEHISTLKTVVSQVRSVAPGETVGYGRHGKVVRRSRIATIAVGYADGYSRAFGNGIGKVMVRGHLAPVIGNVCMDMTMIDVTDIPVVEGDEVIIFGENPGIDELAKAIHTIPYEILTGVHNRVKRVYFTG